MIYSKKKSLLPVTEVQKRILKLKMNEKFFERGEEVFDHHENLSAKGLLTLKNFHGVPMIIGDRWSTVFKKMWFSVSGTIYGSTGRHNEYFVWNLKIC